ncbi:MAG: helix-turn-helix domain-containing protein [Candidatus Jordarchaeales archaeon]
MMPLKPVSKELLGNFGLSEGEINVYLAALSLGEFSVYDLACHLSLPEEAIKDAVEQLVERGFLRRLPASVERYVALEPFLELFIELYERAGRDLHALRDELSSSFEEASRRLRDLSKTIVGGVSDELSGATEDVRLLLDSLVGEYKKIVEEGGDILRGVVVSVEELLGSFLSTFMLKMRDVERFEGNAIPLSEIMREFLRRVDEGVRITTDAQLKLISALQSEVSRHLDGLMVQVRTMLENHYKSHVKSVEELVQALGEIIGGEMKRLREFVEKQEVDSTWLVEGMTVRVGGLIQSAGRKFTHLVTDALQRERELAKVFLSKLDELVGKASVIAKNLESLSRTKGSILEKFSSSKIRTAMEAWSREVSSLAGSLRETYSEILSIEEELVRRVEDEVVRSTVNALEEERENLQNVLMGIRKEVEERLSVLPEIFETKITNEINSSLLRSTRGCEDATNAIISFMSDEFKALVKSLVSSLASYAQEVSELFASYAKGAIETVKLVEFSVLVLRRKASMIMQEKAYEYDRKGEALIENVEKVNHAKLAEVKGKVAARREIINQKVVRELDGAASSIEEVVGKARKTMENATLKIREGVEVLEDIWHRSLDVTPIYTGTWTITGKDAIAKQMVSMLKRTKKSATIILPQPNNEVLEAVKHVEDGVKVKVAVQVAVELPVLRELALLNNVEIHWCSDAAFWGIVIDGKEVLIAPVDHENPPVATVSVQEGAVKLYGEIIEAFLASAAKKKEQKTAEERRIEYI